MSHYKSSLNLTSSNVIAKDELKKLGLIVSSLFDSNDSVEFRIPVDWEALGLMDYPDVINTPMDLSTVRQKLNDGAYTIVEDCIEEIQIIWDNCKDYNAENSWIYNVAEKLEKYFRKLVKNYLPSINVPAPQGSGSREVRKQQRIAQKNTDQEKAKNDLKEQKDQAPSKSRSKRDEPDNEEIFQEEDLEDQNDNMPGASPIDLIPFSEKIKFSQKVKFLTSDQLSLIISLIQANCPTAFSEVNNQRGQIIVDNIESTCFRTINDQMDTWQNQLQDSTNKKIKKQ